MSSRKTVVLSRSSSEHPSASRMASTLRMHWRVWSATDSSSSSSPSVVSGSCPAVMRRLPFVVAWLYAPTAAGASSVLMVRFTDERSPGGGINPGMELPVDTRDRFAYTSWNGRRYWLMTTMAATASPMPTTLFAESGCPRATVLMSAAVTKYIPPMVETTAVGPTVTPMNVEMTPIAAAMPATA